MRKHGFTLIELLVVISIIALLIAILLPALSKARLRAKETVCMSDMRTLTQVCLIYSTEYRGLLPDLGADYNSSAATTASQIYFTFKYWRDHLKKVYGIQRRHLYCPTNPNWDDDELYYWTSGDETADQTVMARFYFTSKVGVGDTLFNGLHEPLPQASRPLFARNVTDKPRWTLMWSDLNREWPYTPGFVDWSRPNDTRIGSNHLYGNIHDMPEGSHASYLDGHVDWIAGHDLESRSLSGSVNLWW